MTKKRKRTVIRRPHGTTFVSSSSHGEEPDETFSPLTPSAYDGLSEPTEDMHEGTTSAVSPEEEYPAAPATSYPALIDKILHVLYSRKIPITILNIFCCLGTVYIYIHDNNSGVLVDYKAIGWTFMKCLFLVITLILFWVFIYITGWFKNKFSKSS
jgi:hypothetical protein